MSEFNITVDGGSSVRLLTAGKYCDRDIVITATGGGGGLPSTISGVNLHDTETDTPNTYLQGATLKAYNGWTTTDFIPVEDGKFYLAYSTSVIDSKYCSKFNSSKGGASTLIGIINCTNKNRPIFIMGHGGYLRFSGTNAQIDALEFYEVINFNWEVSK
jgi:hypothetical protein